jgi:DNA-binding NarL/FixJ family response regulator
MADGNRTAARGIRDTVHAVSEIGTGAAMKMSGTAANGNAQVSHPGRCDRLGPPGERLSQRELDVLSLVADGLMNEAIARQLFLSVKSIEGIVRAIFGKLDLLDNATHNRRVLAVRWYLEVGSHVETRVVATAATG